MKKFKITLWFENKKQEVIWPDFFIEKEYGVCVSKKQFNYYKEEWEKDKWCFFDFKKKRIYFHETWGSENRPIDYSHKVFQMLFINKGGINYGI